MHTRPHILVVDDEPQITRVLRTSLNAQGYEIRVANDGETALEIVKDFAPDLVITDLAMPNMNGIELCRQLRKISQVPILVLSVRGEERSKIEALDSGADDYVTKPFSTGELLARIRAALRRSPPSYQRRRKPRLSWVTSTLISTHIPSRSPAGKCGSLPRNSMCWCTWRSIRARC